MNAPYRTGPTRGKGTGLFTTRRVEQGECIIEEACLLSCRVFYSSRRNHTPTEISTIEREILTLSAADRSVLTSLASPPPKTPRQYSLNVHRFLLNCLPGPEAFHSRARKNKLATFATMSRINHSCFPNACYHWDQQKQRGTLHALTDIDANTEITITYIADESWGDAAARRAQLDSAFHFTCRCELCGSPNGWTDARRQTLRSYYDYLKPLLDGDAPPPSIRLGPWENYFNAADGYLGLLVQELGPVGLSKIQKYRNLPRVVESRLATA